ncbi:thioesterase superfamily protein [Xylariaceae sp. FL0594]|nr:thioesterase superfamily protein [Xylariaceae sp. FL0594]
MKASKAPDNVDVAHFAAIPWCARLLNGGGEGKRMVMSTPSWRIPRPDGAHGFFAETLNTAGTITHMLEVYAEPSCRGERVDAYKALLTLGGAGVSGHKGVCHGGFVTAVLDEAVGLFIPINLGRGSIPKGTYMTAYLNTTFLRPVPASGTILVRSRITRVEGRKYYTEGEIVDETGEVLTRAEALFIQRRSAL